MTKELIFDSQQEQKAFSFFDCVETVSGAQIASYPMDKRILSPVISWSGREIDQ
jgi:hypothetical protein